MLLRLEPKIELRHGDYVATVAPSAGARITSLECRRGGRSRRLLAEAAGADFEEHEWPKAGAFPMLPFANRLPARGFEFRDARVLPSAGPAGFAVHGVAHRRRWDVLESSRDCVLMRYTHPPGGDNWPWTWSAHEEVRLSDAGLVVRLRVRNDSAQPMPLAMGFHPYHPLGPEAEPQHLQFVAASRRDLDGEGQVLPEKRMPRFGMGRGETVAFAGWSGRLELQQESGGAILVHCEGANGLVLHRPARGDYLCAEPVTSLPGRIGGERDGELLPGQTRELAWTCCWKE